VPDGGRALSVRRTAYAGSMAEKPFSRSPVLEEIIVSLPFAGLWQVRNSPARRVPSHGTDLWGERYAIDFVAVDDRHRTAPSRDWRTLLATEPAERFFAFGRPILAPVDGLVVAAHDGEVDHEGRRSQLALARYMLGQPGRLRQGVGAIAGNHVVIALRDSGAFVALVHLRAGSLRVAVGEQVTTGQQIADCGNSGNSTQPHVHMQIMDSANLSVAQGVPMAFQRFREWPRAGKQPLIRQAGIPGEGSVVEPLPARTAR
jgi:murein DD-endopeptidase MepM/ murein hydrolase activator NlpD